MRTIDHVTELDARAERIRARLDEVPSSLEPLRIAMKRRAAELDLLAAVAEMREVARLSAAPAPVAVAS